MGFDANSAYQRLYEALGGQTGQATQTARRNVVSRFAASVIRSKAHQIGLELTAADMEDLIGKVHLRITQDCTSYNPEFTIKSWLSNRIIKSVVAQEKRKRDREQRILPRIQPPAESESVESERDNEIWDLDRHKSLDMFNTVERKVLSEISVDDILKLCEESVSSNQWEVAVRRLQRNMSSKQIGEELGKTESQVDDLFYRFRQKVIPLLKELGYSISK